MEVDGGVVEEGRGGNNATEMLLKIEQVLACNEAYTKLVNDQIKKVDRAIEHNKAQQQAIVEIWEGEKKERAGNGANFVSLVEWPYFKDSDGMTPSTSALAKEIKEVLGGVDPLMREQPKWNHSELKLLKHGVRTSLINAKIRPLEIKRDVAADALKTATPLTTEEEMGRFRNTMKSAQEEIIRTRSITDAELFAEGYEDVDWHAVSATEFRGRRTAQQLKAFWAVEMAPNPLLDGPAFWTADEEYRLFSLVNPDGKTDWDEVATALGGRSAFQCFERYKQASITANGKCQWTKDEDEKLLAAIVEHSREGEINWVGVAREFTDRSIIQVQGRYERSLDKKVTMGKWAIEEDVLLLKAINIYGDQDWQRIAIQVRSRKAQQCRNRWVNVLDPRRRNRPFLWAELERIIFGLRAFGRHDYSSIAKLLPGRNSGDVKAKIQAIVRYRIDRKDAIQLGNEARPLVLTPKNFNTANKRRAEAWDRFYEALKEETPNQSFSRQEDMKPAFFDLATTSSAKPSNAPPALSNYKQQYHFGKRIALMSGRWVRIAKSPNEHDEQEQAELLLNSLGGKALKDFKSYFHDNKKRLDQELAKEAECEEEELRNFYDTILDGRVELLNDMLDQVLPLEDADYVAYNKLKKKKPTKAEEEEDDDEPEEVGVVEEVEVGVIEENEEDEAQIDVEF